MENAEFGTINGFNEKFCRLLYQKLKKGMEEDKVFASSDINGYRSILPGWTTVVEYLKEQIKSYENDCRFSTVEQLLEETESFLEIIK